MPRSRPPLTVAQILAWADAHWRHTGSWPNVRGTYRVRGWPTKVHTVFDQTTIPRGSTMPKKPCQPLCRALPKFGNLCHVYRWMLLLACWSFSGAAWGGPIHVQLGMPGDVPVPADYDGDGKADPAVFRRTSPSTAQWFIDLSSSGMTTVTFGAGSLDQPVPADYDGDKKADIAVYRPSTGQWFIDGSSSGVRVLTFDPPGDLPVPADYTGDGAADLAVFNPGGEWSILPSPLATAAPEPSSWCLLTLGALSLVVGRKGLPRLCSTWRTSLPLT